MSFPFQAGDVLLNGEGEVTKILVVDDARQIIHVRLYDGTYADDEAVRKALAANTLQWFLGHAPVAPEGVLEGEPRLVAHAPVTEEELEGYRYYMEAMGGDD